MIVSFEELASANDGTTKTVSVSALEDSSGGTETLKFEILNETKTVQVKFAPNQSQTVTVTHTAAGKGLVIVTATGSTETSSRILDVDKQPGDEG